MIRSVRGAVDDDRAPAGFDPLRDEGNAYAGVLRDAGVPVEHLENPTMIHAFWWMLGVVEHSRGVRRGRKVAARSMTRPATITACVPAAPPIEEGPV